MHLEDFEVVLHGEVWSFHFVDPEQMDQAMGMTLPESAMVYINRRLEPLQLLKTFAHELLHVAFAPHYFANRETINEELACELFASLWSQLLFQKHRLPSWFFEGVHREARTSGRRNTRRDKASDAPRKQAPSGNRKNARV